MFNITGNALWHLVMQSDSVSKGVLLLLLVMSVLCWSLFISKLMLVSLHKRQLQKFTEKIKVEMSLVELLEKIAQPEDSLGFYFVSKMSAFLHMVVKKRDIQAPVTAAEVDIILNYGDQLTDTIIEKERSGLAFLSTAAGVGPLLGLFGTVWGLVHAFIRISEQQSADIITVAPGIAEALITTLAGLMVAIPALIMFNYVQVQLRYVECLLQQLADRVGIIIQCSVFVRKIDAQNKTTTTVAHDERSVTHTAG